MTGKTLGFTSPNIMKNGTAPDRTLNGTRPVSEPDAEDLTFDDEGNIFVVIERDNRDKKVRMPMILYYDLKSSSFPQGTVGQWDLSNALPKYAEANKGLEAAMWLPDSYLVANNFYDMTAKKSYDPKAYANHGNGLICVGLEFNGHIYCFAVDKTANNKFTMIQHWFGGNKLTGTQDGTIMSLAYDPSTGYVWAGCDNSCAGSMQIHQIDPSTGRFVIIQKYAGPPSMATYNNEGFTIAPACINGQHDVFWSDDSANDGHSIRMDSIPCEMVSADFNLTGAFPPSGSWPGDNNPVTVDTKFDYGENLSGLKYLESPGSPPVLYGIMNGPANLFRLIKSTDTGKWVQDPTWKKSGMCKLRIILIFVFWIINSFFLTRLNLFRLCYLKMIRH
mmetsp:Transcript_24027/g.23086  ORF Transcript_24027/g.23086 Transcript_24027/m.23086 type:complete len:390 (-) Transcript_24027:509-1678(-)